MNSTQTTIYNAFREKAFGDDAVRMSEAGYGGSIGGEYLRGVRGERSMSDKSSAAYGAYLAGRDYRKHADV